MPSSPDSAINFRDAGLATHLDSYGGRDQRHQRAKQCLQRYQFLMERLLPPLPLEEARSLWVELNGSKVTDAEMLPLLKSGVISALIEDGKHELAKRLRDFGLAEWIAIVDACDRVGSNTYRVENLDAELAEAFGIENTSK